MNGYRMEPVMFMATALAGHMTKHCNHVDNSPDENNNTGGVHRINKKILHAYQGDFKILGELRDASHV